MKAYITYNTQEQRYDLHIDGRLKAHSEGREGLIDLAKSKGYEVVVNE